MFLSLSMGKVASLKEEINLTTSMLILFPLLLFHSCFAYIK